MKKCPECGGVLKILGTGTYGDSILVSCIECGEELELEPDGLGMGGEEWAIAASMEDQEDI